MKIYAFLFMLCYASPSPPTLFATLNNGYTDVKGAITSLAAFERLLKDASVPFNQKLSMKKKRKDLLEYIVYYHLTQQILTSFQQISPALYSQIDTLKDHRGRRVNVYVRIVPEQALPPGVAGTTNIGQDAKDPHTYLSEYGVNTVSVTIAAVKRSLHLLAHELGHVAYQVKNLVAYASFFKIQYEDSNRKSIGHHDNDFSGKSARQFEKRFQQAYLQFIKAGQPQPVSHLTLLKEIQNQVAHGLTDQQLSMEDP